MGDAKDILGLPKLGERGSTEKRKTPKDAIKKPDGVHREVNTDFVFLICNLFYDVLLAGGSSEFVEIGLRFCDLGFYMVVWTCDD